MRVWNWPQLGDKVWKVLSDYEAGIICVFDEHGNLIMKKENLSEESIRSIEDNFLDIITNNNKNKEQQQGIFDNPMYA